MLKRQPSRRLSVADLRLALPAEDDTLPAPSLAKRAKDSLRLKRTRKRIWWKIRNMADEHGLPQEVSMEEYEELRAKDEKRFREDFPSVLWQEERRARLDKERTDRERKALRAARTRDMEKEKRRAAHLALRETTVASRRKRHADLLRMDAEVLARMPLEKQRVASFEAVEREKRSRAAARNREDSAAAAQIALRKQAQEAARREQEAQAEAAARLEAEAALSEKVDLILRTSGTTRGPQRERPPVRSSDEIVVRFSPEEDNEDATALAYNLRALAEYVRRFPRAADHSRKFPQFFSGATLVATGQRLRAEGGCALARALSAGAFPRLETLMLANNDLRFRGCRAVARALDHCGALRRLCLANNNLGDESMRELRLAFGATTKLKLEVLDVSSNQVDDAGAAHLAHLLLGGPPLRELHAASNHIGDAGARALAKAGRTLGSLQRLSVRSNRVSPAVAHSLALDARFFQV